MDIITFYYYYFSGLVLLLLLLSALLLLLVLLLLLNSECAGRSTSEKNMKLKNIFFLYLAFNDGAGVRSRDIRLI